MRSRRTRSSADGRRSGRPLIVVDFGTATTLDAVSAKGEYLGGAICPGVQISADALFQRAARLPRIDVRKPATVVGRTTVGAMESGLFYGYVGMVEGLVRRMSDELGGNALCVATGGLADVIAPETTLIQHVDPDLTLDGLRIVWERNQNRLEIADFRLQIADYCREIETYLCRKNDGHLIRVVGPSFDLVSGWAAQGVPLKVACSGIDRYFERYYRKGPRRRPVQIDFCEADVLDVFDEWRRARRVISRSPSSGDQSAVVRRQAVSRPARKRQSLPAHLERVVLRLTSARAPRVARRRRSMR